MADLLLRMLLGVTCGLAFVLLLRRPARRVFGAAPAFTLWLLPLLMALAPLLPRTVFAPGAWTLPAITITASAVPTSVHAAAELSFAHVLLALWIAGAGVAFGRLALHYFRLLRATVPMPESWRGIIDVVAPDLSVRRVRMHQAGPAVVWALRTLILLPPDFMGRFDADARQLVLRHELSHLRRGDGLWLLLAELAFAVLWFHPLAWVAWPRFRLDQELACDERSLRSLPGGISHYARVLLDSVAARPLPALIPWLTEPQLKERIAMISRIRPRALRRRAGFLAVAAMLIGGLLVAGGGTPARAAVHGSKMVAPPSVDVTKKNANPPKYPEEAIESKHQGRVMLDVTVDAAGNVKGVAIDQRRTNAPPELQTAALQAAAGWTFNPGSKNGKAIGGVVQIPVTFSLTNDGQQCPAGQGRAPQPPFQCAPLKPATAKSS